MKSRTSSSPFFRVLDFDATSVDRYTAARARLAKRGRTIDPSRTHLGFGNACIGHPRWGAGAGICRDLVELAQPR